MRILLREYIQLILERPAGPEGITKRELSSLLGLSTSSGRLEFTGSPSELKQILSDKGVGRLVGEPVTGRDKGGLSGKYPTYTVALSPAFSLKSPEGPVRKVGIVLKGSSATGSDKQDKNVVRGQILSAISEHACIEGLGGSDSFDSALSDKLVAPYVASKDFTDGHMDVLENVYNECLRLTRASQSFVALGKGIAVPGNVGTTTAKVDVKIKRKGQPDADVHVKFNDFDRLIGLQAEAAEGGKIILNASKLAGEIDENWPVAAKYKYLRNKFVEDKLKFKSPSRDKVPSITALGAEKELEILQDSKKRKMFLNYLAANKIPELILKEIKSFFTLEEGGATFFYKFGTTPKDIKSTASPDDYSVFLHVTKMIGNPELFDIQPLTDDTTTYLYQISYEDKPIFVVEARTSGTKHPMQLQTLSKNIDMSALMQEKTYE